MTSATPRARMQRRLRYLYGDERGDAAFAELARLLDAVPTRDRPGDRPGTSGEMFDQADALLITYGDTFLPDHLPLSRGRDVGEADVRAAQRRGPGGEGSPLAALRAFADRHLDGLVSTIHILPFCPY